MSNENKKTLKDVMPEVDYDPTTGQVITDMDRLTSQLYANALMAVRKGEAVTVTPVYKLARLVLNKEISGVNYAKVYSGYPVIDHKTGLLNDITIEDFNGQSLDKAQET